MFYTVYFIAMEFKFTENCNLYFLINISMNEFQYKIVKKIINFCNLLSVLVIYENLFSNTNIYWLF
jgi:hypothetical protein